MLKKRSPLNYIIGAVILVVLGLDYFLLQGDEIYREQTPLSASQDLVIPIDRVGEKHTLLVHTGGEIPIEFRLLAPDGSVAVDYTDVRMKKGVRRTSFYPERIGDHVLSLGYRGGGGSSGSVVDVTVLVNDRRTVTAWLDR